MEGAEDDPARRVFRNAVAAAGLNLGGAWDQSGDNPDNQPMVGLEDRDIIALSAFLVWRRGTGSG
jgi:hypothetical protein